jgi:hypothetical protein
MMACAKLVAIARLATAATAHTIRKLDLFTAAMPNPLGPGSLAGAKFPRPDSDSRWFQIPVDPDGLRFRQLYNVITCK